jgi:GNAT superfamily N-acetyltransferase
MIHISSAKYPSLRSFFHPETPAYPVGLHVLNTGNGRIYADRWPDQRAVLAESAGNLALNGDPRALSPEDLRPLVRGFTSAPKAFAPLLGDAFPDMKLWQRVVLELRGAPRFAEPQGAAIRRLRAADVSLAEIAGEGLAWVGKTWGGMAGLAASGRAWAAFVEGRLVSLACTFFQGDRYEDIGVATLPEFRRLGLSAACAGRLCQDILARGCLPSWNTSPDNLASLRVAEKLGFEWQRDDRLYVVGVEIPAP